MNKNTTSQLLAAEAALIFLTSMPGLAQAQTVPPPAVRAHQAGNPQTHADPFQDDFAGLTYTDEQKAQINKIRQDSASRKATVLKDEKLAPEQKDAMLVGYNRLEYGAIFKVLSPVQQRQVRQKIRARRAADQAAKQSQPKK